MIHWVNCQVVNNNGSASLRRQVLGDVASRGVLIGSLGSEVNTRDAKAENVAPQLQINASYRPTEGGFLVNGKKHFCTVAPASAYLLFWGLAPGTSTNDEGLTISVIQRDESNRAGVTFDSASWDECVGLRATVSWSATLKDVFVPWSNVLGQPGDFVQNDPYTFDLAHIAHLLGTAQGVFDEVVQMVREREYLQTDQVYMYWLAEMHGALSAARANYWYTSWLWEQGPFDECLVASYDALHTARQTALMVSDKAFEICGTRSLLKFLPLERASRDIRTASLHTRDTQLVRLQLRAILNDGKMFSKQKYGDRLSHRKTWTDLGLKAEVSVA
jgi:alkylation response protein AidB-like acyl-CoA dehydrogenase